jgi:hypothetical protein
MSWITLSLGGVRRAEGACVTRTRPGVRSEPEGFRAGLGIRSRYRAARRGDAARTSLDRKRPV